MKSRLRDLVEFMEQWAPLSYAESYDNPGLLLGHMDKSVETVMVAVDASENVIQQAVQQQADCLITHHPLIFHPLKKLTDEERTGKRLLALAEHGIALYSAHTNLDTAPGGNNDYAAGLLGLEQVKAVARPGEQACLRIGQLPEALLLEELGTLVKKQFSLSYLRLIGEAQQEVRRVAICTGSGMDFMSLALQEGADVLITGDIGYHDAEQAKADGLALIDASHFGTDRLSVTWTAETLRKWAQETGYALRVCTAEEPVMDWIR